jgi:hypothetical protein
VDINKKITKMILLKPVPFTIYRYFSDNNQFFKSSKAVWLIEYRIRNFKKVYQKSIYKQTDYLLFLSTVKQQELILLQMKYQFENDL